MLIVPDFDEATHTYRVDGFRAPGVTEILSASNIGHSASEGGYEIPEDVMDEARDRGSAVHLACQFLDENDLDEDELDDELLAYLQCYRQFKDETGFVPEQIEQRVYSAEHDYAGTPDRVGWIGDERVIVDLKTGGAGIKPWHGIQLAAYSHAVSPGKPLGRIVVEFKPHQKRRLHRAHWLKPEDFEWDLSVFLAARTLWTWREINGR